ncbi:MAG: hypothetical protein ACRD26_09000 [Vicinamibacterales bacterium]
MVTGPPAPAASRGSIGRPICSRWTALRIVPLGSRLSVSPNSYGF